MRPVLRRPKPSEPYLLLRVSTGTPWIHPAPVKVAFWRRELSAYSSEHSVGNLAPVGPCAAFYGRTAAHRHCMTWCLGSSTEACFFARITLCEVCIVRAVDASAVSGSDRSGARPLLVATAWTCTETRAELKVKSPQAAIDGCELPSTGLISLRASAQKVRH